MNTGDSKSALHRKVAAGQRDYQSRSMTAARALRLTFPKVADDQMEMALAVIGLTQSVVVNDAVLDPPPDTRMLILLDGPDGKPGAVLLDSVLATGFVQQQTMGNIREVAEGETTRKTTRTEAALIAPYLDKVLQQAALLPEDEDDVALFKGREFGDWIETPRLLGMALEEPEYQRFSLTLDLALGTRQGKLDIFLPLPRQDAEEAEEPETEVQAGKLDQIALGVHAQLTVALCRPRMTLSQVTQLSVGDIIPIPADAFAKADILAITGRVVGRGRIGQVSGKRAVRLMLPSVTDPPRQPLEMEDLVKPKHDLGQMIDPDDFASDQTIIDAVADIPDLPDMPDLDDLSDLPELDDLSDLPELSETGS